MKVFISHSQETKGLTRQVLQALKHAGLDVWDEDYDIYPGDNWAKVTGEALEQADAMVVLLTPEALDSINVHREILYTLGVEKFENRLIGVLVGVDHERAREKVPTIRFMKTITMPESQRQEEGINQITLALKSVA